MADQSNGKNTGKIVEIKGVVLDAVFPDRLPEIFHAVSIEVPEDGGTRELIAEVQQHLGDDRVRAVAMDSTDGLARGVEVTLQLTPQQASVLGDAVQLQQVLLNLIVNACEAMSGRPCSERRLTIATRILEDGRTIECSVRDRGHGISEQAMERIFEPFVTTRHQGLGLGLAICRSIVTAHGGRLAAANAADRGAVFHFTLRRRRPSYATVRAASAE